MSLKARLEAMCWQIDAVLDDAGQTGRVAGGYVAGNSVLFTLCDTTFPDDDLREQVRLALGVTVVKATAGAVIVNGWLPGAAEVIGGECVSSPATVGVLDLIAMHQAEAHQLPSGAR